MVQGDSYTYDEPQGGENIGQVGGENTTKVEELKLKEELKGEQKLTEEDLKKIFEEVEKQGNEEAKYFLKLTIFSNKCHPDTYYKESYVVLHGDVKEITINEVSDSCTKYEDVVIIPETKTAIILFYDGYGNPATVYLFTFSKGWLKVDL